VAAALFYWVGAAAAVPVGGRLAPPTEERNRSDPRALSARLVLSLREEPE